MSELSANAMRRVDLVCDAFDRACRDGQCPRIEDYLAGADPDLVPALREELIRVELEWRCLRGEPAALAEYQQRFPDCTPLLPAWLDEARAAAAGRGSVDTPGDPGNVPPGPETFTHVLRPPAGAARPADVPAALTDHPRYQVLRLLGQGGMGAVYLAEHKVMKRPVALKIIRPELTARPQAVERFRREVETAARLLHPNIVAAHDAEQAGDCLFLVMEYVEGTDLACWLKEHGPLPVAEACDCVRQAALGLHHAHEHGMVHRDLKPHNLMRTSSGQVKVLDFGVARLVQLVQEGGTASGLVLGTPDYMAPEQADSSHAADIRSDIYSLGCTLYQLLCDRVPYPGGGPLDKLRRLALEPPEPLARLRPEVPAALVRVVEKMMARDPAQRYQTPAEMVAALEPWCHAPSEPTARPRRHASAWGWSRGSRTIAIAGGGILILLAAIASLLPGWYGQEKRQQGKPPDLPRVKPGDSAQNLSQVAPLLDDDFKDPNKCHFPAGTDQKNGNDFRFAMGQYVVDKPQGSRDANIAPNLGVEGDFACQIIGRCPAEGGDGWGLLLKTYDPNLRRLVVRLCQDGAVQVGHYPLGAATGLVPTGEAIRHTAVHPGDQLNTLLVIVRGRQWLEIYVNGIAISPPIQLEERLASPVYPGLISWSRQAEIHRFSLWLLPPPPPPETGADLQAPELPRKRICLDENFSDPEDRYFRTARVDTTEFLREKGRYVLRNFGSARDFNWTIDKGGISAQGWHVPLDPLAGDLACQVEGRVVSEGDCFWVVGFCTATRDRSVGVRLRRDGTVEVGSFLHQSQPRGPVTLVGPIRHAAIHPGDQPNTLLLILRGGQRLEFYVNGTAITRPIQLEHRLPSVSPGVGVWERDNQLENKARAEFTRFTVWLLSPAASIVP
jgi:tRNA A-37 threonylcarbamoyl transferase component Bud32